MGPAKNLPNKRIEPISGISCTIQRRHCRTVSFARWSFTRGLALSANSSCIVPPLSFLIPHKNHCGHTRGGNLQRTAFSVVVVCNQDWRKSERDGYPAANFTFPSFFLLFPSLSPDSLSLLSHVFLPRAERIRSRSEDRFSFLGQTDHEAKKKQDGRGRTEAGRERGREGARDERKGEAAGPEPGRTRTDGGSRLRGARPEDFFPSWMEKFPMLLRRRQQHLTSAAI